MHAGWANEWGRGYLAGGDPTRDEIQAICAEAVRLAEKVESLEFEAATYAKQIKEIGDALEIPAGYQGWFKDYAKELVAKAKAASPADVQEETVEGSR